MKACLKLFAAFLPFTLLAAPPASGAISEPVHVEGGLISGIPAWARGVRQYRGIPYAAPPVGNLRWRPAQPVVPWAGVKVADKFSAACMQLATPQDSAGFMDGMTPMSEDCLYLNVWTPAKSPAERLPVMVWLHGGAMVRNSASEPLYDGSSLAKKGVVVVSLNYRLNIFGFLAHPELTKESDHHASGNYGLLDQIAALKWVQKNIAQFGGDPNQITVFGHSAGSRSINMLMASPLGKGLFQRAIAQSHTVLGGVPTLAQAEAAGLKTAQAAGAESLAALRAMPAEKLLDLTRNGGGSSSGNIDGWYLEQDVYATFAAGKQNDVPLLTGSMADEGEGDRHPPKSAAQFLEQMRRTYGAEVDEFLKVYPAGTDAQAVKAHHDSGRDSIEAQHRLWAQLQSTTGKSKVFVYLFSHVPPFPEGAAFSSDAAGLGAYHGAENHYIFNTLRIRDWLWTDEDRKLADMMGSYWTNFAKTGDPNGPGLPRWPVYDANKELLFNLDVIPKVEAPRYKAGLDFFEARLAKERGN
jgi:para-nitrobenzyl esterase